jgi:hypothetical protein
VREVSYVVSLRHEASLTSFMVKATRDQSSDAPNRVNWLVIFSWYLRVELSVTVTALHLVMDALILPLPHLLQELLSAIIVSRVTLRLDESCLDDRLRRDTRVIVSREIKHGVSLHTFPVATLESVSENRTMRPTTNDLPSHERIFDSDGEGVTDVEVTSNIWRREDDGEDALVERVAVLLVPRLEETLLGPPLVVGRLDLDGVVPGRRQVARDV